MFLFRPSSLSCGTTLKRSIRAFTIALALLPAGSLQAQVGVSFRLMSGTPVALGVPIRLSPQFLFEPLVVVDRYSWDDKVRTADASSQRNEGSRTNFTAATAGYFLVIGSDALAVSVGGRLGWSIQWENRMFEDQSEGTIHRWRRESTGHTGREVAALLGVHSFIVRRLSIGGEFEWSQRSWSGSTTETESGADPTSRKFDANNRQTVLSAALVIRWFPSRANP